MIFGITHCLEATLHYLAIRLLFFYLAGSRFVFRFLSVSTFYDLSHWKTPFKVTFFIWLE